MQFQSQVLSNVEVSPGYFRMRMTAPPAVLDASSGQFVMVKVSRAIDPLLRRPFGIYDMGKFVTPYTDSGHQTFLEILYKVVGRGTGMLADLHQGDSLDIIAPLGKGFDLGEDEEEKILAERPCRWATGREYVAAVTVEGRRIRGEIEGLAVLAAEDDLIEPGPFFIKFFYTFGHHFLPILKGNIAAQPLGGKLDTLVGRNPLSFRHLTFLVTPGLTRGPAETL